MWQTYPRHTSIRLISPGSLTILIIHCLLGQLLLNNLVLQYYVGGTRKMGEDSLNPVLGTTMDKPDRCWFVHCLFWSDPFVAYFILCGLSITQRHIPSVPLRTTSVEVPEYLEGFPVSSV